ncbi:magnesium protoporphyrin IX methyltransferase [Rhodobacterales bacterium HKCCE3408]|nr:magnesium protoporphyrin IX methyltransferase [Rhodobacterales bacterium HKCCE3408]
MLEGSTYGATRDRVEAYFDRTATRAWEALTSEAPVSRIRQTVREGRDSMRAVMLSRLPHDLSGARILDAGCGTGATTAELAARGADVVGVDIAPELIRIAEARLPEAARPRVRFHAGDMLDRGLGSFDAVVAMDSLIYYDVPDLLAALSAFDSPQVVFTVAPRTPLLMAMWTAGKLFPRDDRSPRMVPQDAHRLSRTCRTGSISRIERVARGFYISECLEFAR